MNEQVHVHVPIVCREPGNLHIPFQAVEMGLCSGGMGAFWYSLNGDVHSRSDMCWVEKSQLFCPFYSLLAVFLMEASDDVKNSHILALTLLLGSEVSQAFWKYIISLFFIGYY